MLTLGGGSALTVNGEVVVAGDSTILCQGKDNAAKVGDAWVGVGIAIAAGNLTVQAGSSISADGQGYVGINTPNTSGLGPGRRDIPQQWRRRVRGRPRRGGQLLEQRHGRAGVRLAAGADGAWVQRLHA